MIFGRLDLKRFVTYFTKITLSLLFTSLSPLSLPSSRSSILFLFFPLFLLYSTFSVSLLSSASPLSLFSQPILSSLSLLSTLPLSLFLFYPLSVLFLSPLNSSSPLSLSLISLPFYPILSNLSFCPLSLFIFLALSHYPLFVSLPLPFSLSPSLLLCVPSLPFALYLLSPIT